MTLLAHPLPWPRLPSAAAGATAARGFVELDDRVSSCAPGVALIRAPSAHAARAICAHLARRIRAGGRVAVEARALRGSPLWQEVAMRLGVSSLPSEPAQAAEAIARTA